MVWLTKNYLYSFLFLISFGLPAYANRPNFKKHSLEINAVKLVVEIADDSKKTAYGLMNIDELPKGIDGMLFVFPKREKLSFWMKNTRIPLSIAYIDDNYKIISIQDMEPESSMLLESRLKRYQSPKAVRYALELKKGDFEKRGIKLGDSFKNFYP